MAYSPPLVVQGPVTEDTRQPARVDSLHTPLLHNKLKNIVFQQPTPGMSRLSVSPTKAYSGNGETSRPSPRTRDQKQVTFELLLPVPQHRARLPMRVMISKHDNTDSIITTVKNFYGLYDGPGVSFEDRQGNILIAAYDNFVDGMTVFVKVSEDAPMVAPGEAALPVTASPRKPKLGPPFEMRPPAQSVKPGLATDTRSPSPVSTKSHGSNPNGKSKHRPPKSQDPGTAGDGHGDIYSDSDGGNGSVTSSRRGKVEPHASAEISVENIVEGGRRKRAKFESCELPLFVPPQVPVTTSMSSVSPQRRAANGELASPLPNSNQRTFVYNQPLPSPQSHGRSDGAHAGSIQGGTYGQGMPFSGPQPRGRTSISYPPPRRSIAGILPTPEPTVGSVISDEDVALQLMRLGDVSNFSHGRTSTSTLDDALSGKAEAASSVEESDEGEDIQLPGPRYPLKDAHHSGPARKKQRTERSASVESSGDDYQDGSFKGDSDDVYPGNESEAVRQRNGKGVGPVKPRDSVSSGTGPGVNGTKVKVGKPKSKPASEAPSRKPSLGSTGQQLGPDEEDLSAKPRCQRCRKSKKGCDRQRPCGRCKDAGIGIDGCVSEDEGNGRRGRYGRHMGVAIKKETQEVVPPTAASPVGTPNGTFLTPAIPSDKNKKRKRPA